MQWALLPVGVVLLHLVWTATAIKLQYDSALVRGRSFRQRFFAGDFTTTIDFQLSVHKADNVDGFLELILMNGDAILSFPGKTRLHPGVLSFCCSEELLQSGLCPIADSIIISKQQDVIWRDRVPFGTELRTRLSLKSNGPHALLISNCGPNSAKISGYIEIKSARGGLPLHLYNLSTFYWFVAKVFAFALVAVVIVLIPFWNEIHFLHGILICALMVMVAEFSLWANILKSSNDSVDTDGILGAFAIVCALVRRSAVFASVAFVVYGYGLGSRFLLSDLSPIDRKQLTLLTALYCGIQALSWWHLSEDSFVVQYNLSPFFLPLLIDTFVLAFLIKPALKTKALLSGTRSRTLAATSFDRFFVFMMVVIILFIVNCGMSINFAENRGYIRHHAMAFLFPEAVLQMSHAMIAVTLVFCIFPLGPHMANINGFQWCLRRLRGGRNNVELDEIAPLGSG